MKTTVDTPVGLLRRSSSAELVEDVSLNTKQFHNCFEAVLFQFHFNVCILLNV